MTLKLIKASDKTGHTIMELMVASIISVIVLSSVIGAYIVLKDICNVSIAAFNLQRDATMVVNSIIKRYAGEAAFTGLRSAKSYIIPVVVPSGSEIQFFEGPDGTGTRRGYFLQSNRIVYESFAITPRRRTIYTAPPNAQITLRFWPASADNETVGIYCLITQRINSGTASRTVSGEISTFVNLRNLPK